MAASSIAPGAAKSVTANAVRDQLQVFTHADEGFGAAIDLDGHRPAGAVTPGTAAIGAVTAGKAAAAAGVEDDVACRAQRSPVARLEKHRSALPRAGERAFLEIAAARSDCLGRRETAHGHEPG